MNAETKFRKVFCEGCDYLSHDWEDVGCKKGEVVCSIPCTKNCVLQDWKLYARRARKFIKGGDVEKK